jgi:F-type H+-transporting ATPase subunit delta
MNQSKITVRYSKALFQLALEKNKLDAVYKDMVMIYQSLKEFIQFDLYLKSPVVKPSQKLALIKEAFTGNVEDISLNFLGLLVQNKRENHLEGIIRRFFDDFLDYKNIKSAVLFTAVAISDQVKERFRVLLSSIYKSGIDLEAKQNAAIMGGFILQVKDQQYDASVATGLKRMKTALLTEK